MEFHSDKKENYYLEVKVLKDLECKDIEYIVDGKVGFLPISNQGHYAIYLGHFSFCQIEEHKYVEIAIKAWDSKLEAVIQTYKNSLLESVESNALEI